MLLFITNNSFNCYPALPETAVGRIRSDEGLTLETSASESLDGGQFTSSTQLIEPNYLVGRCSLLRER